MELTPDQVTAVREIYQTMRNQAITAGNELIRHEQDLDDHFKSGSITDEVLREKLKLIAQARLRLRYIHLSAHLRTPPILTSEQIARYNELRGYGGGEDPCKEVPAGHNETMWRLHNNCE